MTPSEKAAAVHRVDAFLLEGHSLNKSCTLANVPKASYIGWKRKLEEHDIIADRRTEASGRKPKFQLTQAETDALRGYTTRFDSFAFAVETFARSQECSAEVSEMINQILADAQRRECQPKFPLALQRLARSSDMEDDSVRGAKAIMNHAQGSTKGMFWEDEKGEIRPLFPWSVWQLDDYSANEPYIIPTTENGDRLCRQVLTSLDVYSSAWLGFYHVGRERDAYRGEDIARFVLNLIDAHGTMPEALMFEMGAWNSEVVHGIPIPGTDDRRWGGWKELFHVVNGFTSRFKAALESSHRLLQTALRLSGRSVGSFRGEMESGTKAYLKAQAGKLDPVKAGFLTQDASSLVHEDTGHYLNARPKMRRAFGGRHLVPDALLNEGTTLRPLPASERWRFYPIKRPASVRGNFVEVRAKAHYQDHFIFRVNGIEDVHFQPGHKVFIAFDPLALHLGAVIANAESGTLNRAGWRMGQILLTAAPLYEMTPQFSFRPRFVETAAMRKTNAAIRSMFKAIRPFTKPGLAITTTADGRGNVREIRTNDPTPVIEQSATTPRLGFAEFAEPVLARESRVPAVDALRVPARQNTRSSNDLETLDLERIRAAEAAMAAEGSDW